MRRVCLLMAVDRCVCHRVTFATLKELAASTGGGFDVLSRATGCSTSCGMCKPYVLMMLRTGRTSFRVLTMREVEELLRDEAMRADECPRE
jgi:bacterioferritin-associated ferredoxin